MDNTPFGRKPSVTAWVVQDDPNPDNWTVNIQASILQAYLIIRAMGEGAICLARAGNKEAAEVAYYMAEDLNFQLDKIGGSEAAIRIAKNNRKEQA